MHTRAFRLLAQFILFALIEIACCSEINTYIGDTVAKAILSLAESEADPRCEYAITRTIEFALKKIFANKTHK